MMPWQPRALELHSYDTDPAKALRLIPSKSGVPGSGEATLRLLAAPINPADLNLIEGRYGIKPELPHFPGIEGVFEIIALGAGTAGAPAVGSKVLLLSRAGSWQEQLNARVEDCLVVPKGIDPLQAAQLRVNPATAWRMLHDFVKPEPGAWVLQNAGNSAVGRCVIQLAKLLGLKTASLVRRAELIGGLETLGGDLVLEDTPDAAKTLKNALKKHGGRPLLALNAVGGESAATLAKSLAPGGTLVTYGAMGRKPLTLPNGLFIFNGLKATGFWVSRWYEQATAAEAGTMLGHLAEAMVQRRLLLPVEKIYPLEEWQAALTHAAQSGRCGKILFKPN
jgi:trans-2-enoyl-CoA reductase